MVKIRGPAHSSVIIVENYIKEYPGCTASDIFKKTELSFPTAVKVSRFLIDNGSIKYVKEGLKKKLYSVEFKSASILVGKSKKANKK